MSIPIDYPHRKLGDFAVGDVRERLFQMSHDDLQRFAYASGDRHPLHTNSAFARSRGYGDVLLHGMSIAARSSAFVAEEFVGSHGLLVSMNADFRSPVFCGDRLTWHAEVLRVDSAARSIEIKWAVLNDQQAVLQRGTACAYFGGKM